MRTVSDCRYEHADYIFKPNEYALIRTFSENSPENVVFIWEIFSDENTGAGTYDLLVTRYSMLNSAYPFNVGISSDDTETNVKELLLHFGDFDKMGTQDDAEIIHVRDICSARDFALVPGMSSDDVDHVLRPPSGESSCSQDRLDPVLTHCQTLIVANLSAGLVFIRQRTATTLASPQLHLLSCKAAASDGGDENSKAAILLYLTALRRF